jgi:acyl-CoA reductase-like NAD-dependent aldehyde dehydrogenase
MKISSVNPATGEVNKEFDTITTSQVKQVAKKAHAAFEKWSALDLSERIALMSKLSATLKQKSNEYGRLMTVEMGKPIKQSITEVEKCAFGADTYVQNAEKWLADEPIQTEAKRTFIVHQPLGVILGVMPWNFPFWQAMRFAIPALTAGNTAILRHSNVCPMSALAIEESFRLSGFPDGVFQTIITDHDEVKRLIKNPLISGVSLTGSLGAGRKVGEAAGKNIKKFVLELGGSDPFIVLEDAEMEMTAKGAVEGRLVNSGQSCICSKRFIVVKEVADEFTRRFAELMKLQKVGDPLDMNTNVGPLADKQQIDILEKQVNDSVAMGAKILCGGHRVPGNGYFFEPTVLAETKPNMPVLKEEVFGPVAAVVVVKNEKDAIKMANKSKLGLGGSVWSKDTDHAERVARQLQTGMVAVNAVLRSDPRIPFGGVKESGIGRELSRYGLLEFTNAKAIIIN